VIGFHIISRYSFFDRYTSGFDGIVTARTGLGQYWSTDRQAIFAKGCPQAAKDGRRPKQRLSAGLGIGRYRFDERNSGDQFGKAPPPGLGSKARKVRRDQHALVRLFVWLIIEVLEIAQRPPCLVEADKINRRRPADNQNGRQ
jgi:hypothetical protein